MSQECDEALANLYLYLDAELEQIESEEIRAHLDECPGCIHSFDFEKRLKLVVRQRLNEEVSDEFVARLRQAINDEASRRI